MSLFSSLTLMALPLRLCFAFCVPRRALPISAAESQNTWPYWWTRDFSFYVCQPRPSDKTRQGYHNLRIFATIAYTVLKLLPYPHRSVCFLFRDSNKWLKSNHWSLCRASSTARASRSTRKAANETSLVIQEDKPFLDRDILLPSER
ncbi:hypothetical protein B0H19DRAFT_428823 [Mycena capillaripes]|nr:hypothetical protein B0H19DRAFT_428823 [Mycena capillaripes]